MINSTDLYLGAFLILCGFVVSLLNLRRLIKDAYSSFPAVLISENVLLMCIGITFIIRASERMKPGDIEIQDIEERISEMGVKESERNCNYLSVLKSYGPLIISLVNSFLSLIIDNYMHYRMLANVKKDDEENTVQELNGFRSNGVSISKVIVFGKKYFSYLAIALQWTVPILIAISMYPMELKEQRFLMDKDRSSSDFCMAVIDVSNETCVMGDLEDNFSLELRKLIPTSYIEAHETLLKNDSTAKEINSVVNNVYKIVANMKNNTFSNVNVTSAPLWRKAKASQNCMNVCYLDNKSLTLYTFVVAIVSYFIPITISTVILTKIHMMDIKRPGIKTYVSRELLYNILFWTPVMLDTFLSLLFCSYSMNGMRTSIFNVIANVYQAVKNFMNTKYFHDNSVKPI